MGIWRDKYNQKVLSNIPNSLRQLDNDLRQISLDIATIKSDLEQGDIFRRIEFLQGKLLSMEEIMQRHLLSTESQRNSELYKFITRMRSLFFLSDPIGPVSSGGGKNFVRLGNTGDGGYVMWDDFKDKKYAYSIGICDDVSWDEDMASKGLDVYMYDHTIDSLPKDNNRFHFFQLGLIGDKEKSSPCMRTLKDMMFSNGHADERGMILKIDIEGGEWSFLNDVDSSTLEQFSQIVFEFHGLIFPENEEKITTAVNKLNRTHQCIHIHANNYGSYLICGGSILPELIEGTYLLRKEYDFSPSKGKTAGSVLDKKNCPYLPDIFLGDWTN